MKKKFTSLLIFFSIVIPIVAAPLVILEADNVRAGQQTGWHSFQVEDPQYIPNFELNINLLRNIIVGGGINQGKQVNIIVKDSDGNILLDKYFTLDQSSYWYNFIELIEPVQGGTHYINMVVPPGFKDAACIEAFKD